MESKTLIDFKYGDDTYSIAANDYPNKFFLKEKFASVYEATYDIDIYTFDVTNDVALSVKKNGVRTDDYGEHWAGGKVTQKELVENAMTMYINGLDKSKFSCLNACEEIQQIKAYYDEKLADGKHFVSFRDSEVFSLDIESKNYIGYIHGENCVMLNKNDMSIVTDFPEFYLETVNDILNDYDEDILYFSLSVNELKNATENGDIKCGLSFFNDDEELDLTEQNRGRS